MESASPELAFDWRIVGEAGAGASGIVYEAMRADGTHAALKLVGGGWHEAEVLARVARRWGPRLVDAGVVPAGTKLEAGARYLATTWTEGTTLRAEGDRAALVILALRVAHGVGRGLDELHGVGVRHGDVKPSNIVVAPRRSHRDRAEDRGATLIDLDLAGASGTPLGGTIRYLAPEVRSGDAATPAADVWALGLVLEELIGNERGEIGMLVSAMLARAPGARPSAAWIASRAARMLELAPDEEEVVAERRARVRRSYLAARRRPPLGEIAPVIAGPARAWLEEATAIARAIGGSSAPVDVLDSLDFSRWLVGLVGPAAASWPTGLLADEGEVAARLLGRVAVLPPEALTFDDVCGRAKRETFVVPKDTLDIARALLVPRTDPRLLDIAEERIADAPPSFGIDFARACLRRGEIGRAFAIEGRLVGAEGAVVAGEIARRRGDPDAAESFAKSALPLDDARALLARLAWERGDSEAAMAALGDARGAYAAEVRGLVAYRRGDFDAGLEAVAEGEKEANDDLAAARLAGTRGMLEHVRGRATASVDAFAIASDLATRAGAVIEEATYLSGLAAAAVDAGAIGRALGAATRAALLWERLGRERQAASAHLSRAAAYALAFATHEADRAAADAQRAGDIRATAFARWAMVETRSPGDPKARDEARWADAELEDGTVEDRIRAAARLLVWADGVDAEAIDPHVASVSVAARWEWWGARAATSSSPRVLAELLALLPTSAPVASRGPALFAAARLARDLGDGEAARRFEVARSLVVEALRQGTPPEFSAALATVPWLRGIDAAPTSLAPAQVVALEGIVRALSSRDRLKSLLEQVLDTMILWTGVERGLLLLRAPDGKLVPRAARNIARRDLVADQLALSTGLARRAMDERAAVSTTDAFAQVGDLHASVHALGLRSVLAVPLIARGDVLGVVYLDDRVRRGAFGESELVWVRLVASQAALAIADARDQALLRRAVRRAERAQARLQAELGAREAELFAIKRADSDTRFRYDAIAGRSEPMQAMLKIVDRVTIADVPVLLLGESGTGKELVARALHANGRRSHRAFVGENCGSVPESLLESTLFGHVRGAFTGATSTRPGLFDVADGGTLFLDEIGEMPLAMQTKLLRVLENGEVRAVGSERLHHVDVRIVGATHRDLEAMVAKGTFREDLFYRLNVVSVRVPPLRERAEDIPLLVARFVEKHAGDRRVRVTRAAMERLVAFSWPGNVRQLENEVRRALVLAEGAIDVAELSGDVARGGAGDAREVAMGLRGKVDALEAKLVREALAQTKGNQTRAAELLGLSRFGLQKMMRRLHVARD